MALFDLEGRTLRIAIGAVGALVALGLLAAGFALSIGGEENVERAVEKVKSGEEDQPASVWAGPLRLPTENVALFEEGGGPDFFQYTDRWRDGENLRPWQAGQYGFVRTPVEGAAGDTVFTRFHEANDIHNLRRDAEGEPLDTVRATDAGLVAYTNEAPAASNYGNYVVVEHVWNGAPYFSLYAHLSEVFVGDGARVRQGEALGRVGYTGAGINKRRAHVHSELNVLINENFQRWIDKHFGGNAHGIYSGLNLRGFDPAGYFEALRENPDLTVPEYVRRQEPYYKIAVPNTGPIDMLRRYPWMRPNAGRGATTNAPAWEMRFTRGGFPLAVEPIQKEIAEPTVTQGPPVEEGRSCMKLTYEHLAGTTPECTLAPRGRRYVDLITMQSAEEEEGNAAS